MKSCNFLPLQPKLRFCLIMNRLFQWKMRNHLHNRNHLLLYQTVHSMIKSSILTNLKAMHIAIVITLSNEAKYYLLDPRVFKWSTNLFFNWIEREGSKLNGFKGIWIISIILTSYVYQEWSNRLYIPCFHCFSWFLHGNLYF